ncbi:MAG: DUF2085 domain-containing protein [Bacteroidota bacterium]
MLLLWTSGIFYQCLLEKFSFLLYGYPFAYNAYSLVCHQDPAKVINLSCGNSLVCSRCLGIYFGLLSNSIVHFFYEIRTNKNFTLVLIAIIPMIIDVILTTASIYNYSKAVAITTGFLFGSILFLYLYNGLQNLIIETAKR